MCESHYKAGLHLLVLDITFFEAIVMFWMKITLVMNSLKLSAFY